MKEGGPNFQRSGRFAVVPARAIDDARLRPAALRMLCALGTYGDRDGRCFPALPTIGRRLAISKQAVSKQLLELCRLGYLEILPRLRRDGSTSSNAYRLIFDADLAAIYDRLGGETEQETMGQPDIDGGQPIVDVGQPVVGGPSTSEVDPILERPTRTKDSRLIDSETARQFETFWRIYPSRRPHPNPKKPAALKFLAAVKRGIDPAAIIHGAEAYAGYVTQHGKDSKFTKQAVTWLNQELWTETHEPGEDRPQAGMC